MHDELIFEVTEAHAPRLRALIRRGMQVPSPSPNPSPGSNPNPNPNAKPNPNPNPNPIPNPNPNPNGVQEAAQLRVPLFVKVQQGPSWGELREIEG